MLVFAKQAFIYAKRNNTYSSLNNAAGGFAIPVRENKQASSLKANSRGQENHLPNHKRMATPAVPSLNAPPIADHPLTVI
jgi:hypothetical protein